MELFIDVINISEHSKKLIFISSSFLISYEVHVRILQCLRGRLPCRDLDENKKKQLIKTLR